MSNTETLYLKNNDFLSKRIIVKIGSSSITHEGTPLNKDFVASIARQSSMLFTSGVENAIVSSGAVASGKSILQMNDDDVLKDQVAAIFGQNFVMDAWNEGFRPYGIHVGQVLFSEEDLSKPNTPILLGMKHGIQIINANDATNDIEMKAFLKSADNDRLAGHVADFVKADTLLILTDVEGVLDSNGNVIRHMQSGVEIDFMGKSKTGTGGMQSKVTVGLESHQKGIRTIIANAHENDVILKAAKGISVGTLFV